MDDDAIPWQLDGHPWIGRSVLRFFDGQATRARIIKWAAATDSEPALWHIEHDDGDEEDLEETEAECACNLWIDAAKIEDRIDKAQAQLVESVSQQGELGAGCAVAYLEYGLALMERFEFAEAQAQPEVEGGEQDAAASEGEELTAADESDGEEEGDLQIVWENLDTARQILEKNNGNQLELASVRLALAEVAMQSGQYDLAVHECQQCVEVREMFLEPSERPLAHSYATLANAHGLLGNEEATLAFRRKAITCLEAALFEAQTDQSDDIDDLKALVAEMQQEARELAAGVIARGGAKPSASEPSAKKQRTA